MHKRAAFLLVLLLPGCSTSPQTPNALQNTGKPALHALKSEKLRLLMAQMNSLVFEQIRTEIELDQERRTDTLKIANSAHELQQSVDSILAAQPSLGLAPNESFSFTALADKLKGQAARLEDLARRNRFDDLPPTLTQITSTCSACHSLYRKF